MVFSSLPQVGGVQVAAIALQVGAVLVTDGASQSVSDVRHGHVYEPVAKLLGRTSRYLSAVIIAVVDLPGSPLTSPCDSWSNSVSDCSAMLGIRGMSRDGAIHSLTLDTRTLCLLIGGFAPLCLGAALGCLQPLLHFCSLLFSVCSTLENLPSISFPLQVATRVVIFEGSGGLADILCKLLRHRWVLCILFSCQPIANYQGEYNSPLLLRSTHEYEYNQSGASETFENAWSGFLTSCDIVCPRLPVRAQASCPFGSGHSHALLLRQTAHCRRSGAVMSSTSFPMGT